MRIWSRAAIALLASACVVLGADSGLLRHLMPDAKVVAGANVSQFLASPFGQALAAQARSSRPGLESFVQATGVDPFRDVQEVLAAAPAGAQQNTGLVLIRGAFDPSRLAGLAATSGATVTPYGGLSVMAVKSKETDAWFVFLDGSTAAIGDPVTIRAMIDRRGAGAGVSPELLSLINRYSLQYDFWAVSTGPLSTVAPNVPDQQLSGLMQGDLVRSVVETGGGVKLANDVLLVGEAVTHTEKEATALADVVRFFLGLAQMNAPKDPRAAASMALLKNLELKSQGRSVTLALRISEPDVKSILKQVQSAATARAQAGPSPAASPSAEPAAPPRPSGDIVIQSSPQDMGTIVIPDK